MSDPNRLQVEYYGNTQAGSWTPTTMDLAGEPSSSSNRGELAPPRSRSRSAEHGSRSLSSSSSSSEVDEPSLRNTDAEMDQWSPGGEEGAGHVPGSLPTELLLLILQQLSSSKDLVSAMLVNKSWCLIAFPLLWQRPSLSSITQFSTFARTLSTPETLLPYTSMVRRLCFNGFARDLSDELFSVVGVCEKLERLTLPGATRLTSPSLKRVFRSLHELIAIDLHGVDAVNDDVLRMFSTECPQLQGINLTKCKHVGDEGVLAIASNLKMLRRIKLSGCYRLTDRPLVALTRSCPLLLELDVAGVRQLSNDTLIAMLFNCAGLREVRMNENESITEEGIPNLAEAAAMDAASLFECVGAYSWYLTQVRAPKATFKTANGPPDIDPLLIRPVTITLDQLRMVDFTSCTGLNDQSIHNLISNAPQLRNITLTKCTQLTDASLDSICRLGRQLHYLHLGHVSNITDDAVVRLARTCTRLRYLDVANCSNLTDESVIALATNLTKLRRVGLVKVTEVTDTGIQALAQRFATLERVHLSYCDKISVKAVWTLLSRLPLLTHLSLTGIAAFITPELQQFSRDPPESFTPAQRSYFCVFSNRGVEAVREYLDTQMGATRSPSEGSSTRRGSVSSCSTSTGRQPTPVPVEASGVENTTVTSETSADGMRFAVPESFLASPRHSPVQGGPSRHAAAGPSHSHSHSHPHPLPPSSTHSSHLSDSVSHMSLGRTTGGRTNSTSPSRGRRVRPERHRFG